jgi:hypothetical protein
MKRGNENFYGNQVVLNSICRNIRLTLKIAAGMFAET